MKITQTTNEEECCCSCIHNNRKSDEKQAGIYCECELDGHYIDYVACFVDVCEKWKFGARCAMGMRSMKEQTCATCKWYAEYEGVCCNGDSDHRGGFRDGDDSCDEWEGTDEFKSRIPGTLL